MIQKVIFADGYGDDDDIQSLARDLRSDVLSYNQNGNLYNPFFITVERIRNEFDENRICYIEHNLVLLHSVTKENILKAVIELYDWEFEKRWVPLSKEQLQTFFYPREDWVTFQIDVPTSGK